METENVEYFPLDVTKLVKGQVLTISELEKIMGVSYSDREHWWSRLLNLKQQIERLRSRMGLTTLTIKTHKGALVICDDEQAAEYNRSMGKRGIRRFTRSHVRNLAVDTLKLSAASAEAHQRTIMRQAMMLSAINRARHQQLPIQNTLARTTPKMVMGPKHLEQKSNRT